MALTTENLVMLIAQGRDELAELATLRKKAWSCEGHEAYSHLFVCQGYHARWTHWEKARLDLARLEREYSEALAAETASEETEPPP